MAPRPWRQTNPTNIAVETKQVADECALALAVALYTNAALVLGWEGRWCQGIGPSSGFELPVHFLPLWQSNKRGVRERVARHLCEHIGKLLPPYWSQHSVGPTGATPPLVT